MVWANEKLWICAVHKNNPNAKLYLGNKKYLPDQLFTTLLYNSTRTNIRYLVMLKFDTYFKQDLNSPVK